MEEIKRKLYDNYLLGIIKYQGSYSPYLMPIAWWILNYEMYDPSYEPSKWNDIFRNNILNVVDAKTRDFIKAIESDKIDIDELRLAIDILSAEYRYIFFYVDFDDKLFVSGFQDIEVEAYLPNKSWRGLFGNPLEHLPEHFSSRLGNVSN